MLKNNALIKRLLSFAFVLMLIVLPFGQASASELIDADEIQKDKVVYKTTDVSYGDIHQVQSAGALLYYPRKWAVVYNGPDAIYEGLAVTGNRSDIKEGDPLFKIRVPVDEVSILEKELAVERENEALASGAESYQKNLSKLTEEMNALPAGRDKEKAALKIRIAEVQQEQFVFRENNRIEQLKKELDDLYEIKNTTLITAPASGSLTDIVYYSEGDMIRKGTQIATIIDTSIRMVRTETAFPYGTRCTVEVGGRETQNLPGMVVASSVSNGSFQKPFSLIDITEGEIRSGVTVSRGNMRVHMNVVDLQHVLKVSREALDEAVDSVSASILGEDSMPHKRSIKTMNITGSSDAWVLDGLSEGDKVITKQ